MATSTIDKFRKLSTAVQNKFYHRLYLNSDKFYEETGITLEGVEVFWDMDKKQLFIIVTNVYKQIDKKKIYGALKNYIRSKK